MNGVKVKLNPDSYKSGYQAGYNREKPAAPAGCDDLGWYSGYIEGKADRYHGRRNRMEPVLAELEGSSCYPGTVNGTLTAACPHCGQLDGAPTA
ncbi:hypothetical protein [Marispirochaeta aestuarii]|uniref:hypothetical protein n=1 Tax=Marispirochaeta aestuarii TaxID=1963862 RepID=UPI0029C8192B|nr:hypothetical protein [Marispirochaeta aestuarii]